MLLVEKTSIFGAKPSVLGSEPSVAVTAGSGAYLSFLTKSFM